MKLRKKPKGLSLAELVIWRSETAEPGLQEFKAVRPEEVPMWLKDPDTLGLMLDGQVVHKEGEPGWFIAMKADEVNSAGTA